MKWTVFVDLDGVLVDFVGGAMRLHGVTLPLESVRWDLAKQFALSPEAFWTPMDYAFWQGLEWTREGKELLAGLEMLVGGENVVLLSSPCDTHGCVEGKVAWIRRECPSYSRRFFIGPPKHSIAGPGKLLVDDYDGNEDAWLAGGGQAVLVPRPWNGLREECLPGHSGFGVGNVLGTVAEIVAGK